jgi:hypothetical protein
MSNNNTNNKIDYTAVRVDYVGIKGNTITEYFGFSGSESLTMLDLRTSIFYPVIFKVDLVSIDQDNEQKNIKTIYTNDILVKEVEERKIYLEGLKDEQN